VQDIYCLSKSVLWLEIKLSRRVGIRITLTDLTPLIRACPMPRSRFQCNMSWSPFLFCVLRWSVIVRLVNSWNCWPSLFKLSVHNIIVCFTYRVRVMVCYATFNNISIILWRSVLLVEKTGVLGENHRPVTSHWQTLSLVVIGTDCTGNCKSTIWSWPQRSCFTYKLSSIQVITKTRADIRAINHVIKTGVLVWTDIIDRVFKFLLCNGSLMTTPVG
jgi:hypothetical protein